MALTTASAFGFERAWLARGLSEVRARPDIFAPSRIDTAVLAMGIGKRKVSALRFWLRVLGLVRHADAGRSELTPLGHIVGRWDPEFEELGTWAVLHYHLAADPDGATAYCWVSNHLRASHVTTEELQTSLGGRFADVSARTIADATSCVMHLLSATPLSCALGLYRDVGNGAYARTCPSPDTLHAAAVAYAVLDWGMRRDRRTLNIEELLQPEAPGTIFHLSPSVLDSYLDDIVRSYRRKVLSVSRTAGLNSITIDSDVHPLQVLEAYYLQHLEGLDPLDAIDRAATDGFALELLAQEEDSDGPG